MNRIMKIYIGIMVEICHNFKDSLWETAFTHGFLAKNKNKKQIKCTRHVAHNHKMSVKFFESSTKNTYVK